MNTFEEDNKITLGMINYINQYLKDLGDVYIIPYINIHSIFLKEFGLKNNNLILLPKGCGKTTFLKALARGNPKVVNVLPEKMHESFLCAEPDDFFNNRVLVHYDFIDAVGGLDTKQREQLIGFWSTLLSDGRYFRQSSKKELKNINCVAMFGMAKENFDKHKTSFFEATFLDRLVMIMRKINRKEKKEIMVFRRKQKEIEKFKVKMITSKRKIKVEIDQDKFGDKIEELALELDDYDVLTFTRGQDYIAKFLKCNAYINDREEVNENDLLMYERIHKHHLDRSDIDKLAIMLDNLRKNPKLSINNLIQITNWSKPTVIKYRKMAKERIDE